MPYSITRELQEYVASVGDYLAQDFGLPASRQDLPRQPSHTPHPTAPPPVSTWGGPDPNTGPDPRPPTDEISLKSRALLVINACA
ncbi:hypothetical protein TWF730_005533 [Orbilia blumenaviensis]|uniref:Uncharacterized protein n=1 Tax=Orbilia blumenaviensis TaxID=1796055 RepID=A0AAV9VJ21_9PEZI